LSGIVRLGTKSNGERATFNVNDALGLVERRLRRSRSAVTLS